MTHKCYRLIFHIIYFRYHHIKMFDTATFRASRFHVIILGCMPVPSRVVVLSRHRSQHTKRTMQYTHLNDWAIRTDLFGTYVQLICISICTKRDEHGAHIFVNIFVFIHISLSHFIEPLDACTSNHLEI